MKTGELLDIYMGGAQVRQWLEPWCRVVERQSQSAGVRGWHFWPTSLAAGVKRIEVWKLEDSSVSVNIAYISHFYKGSSWIESLGISKTVCLAKMEKKKL